MKKIVIFFLFAFLSSGLAWGQEYPRYTIEKVNFAPELYFGLIVQFDETTLYPYSLTKDPRFSNPHYGLRIYSKGLGSLYLEDFEDDDITFYAGYDLASNIVNEQFVEHYFKANLLCAIEKATVTYTDGTVKTLWMSKIIKISVIDNSGNVIRILTDQSTPLTNPIADAVTAERARWDANGDNKIGLEEAIRALQIVSGVR